MTRATRTALALLLALPFAAAAPPAAAEPPPIPEGFALPAETFTLANGMRVVIDEDHRAPRVEIELLFDAGIKDDPQGRAGLASVMEYLFRYASPRQVTLGDTPQLFAVLGGAPAGNRVEALDDYTRFHMEIEPRALAAALWLTSTRVGFFADGIEPDMVARAVEHVRGARSASAEESAMDQVAERVFGAGHPYAHVFGGPHADDLSQLTAQEARARAKRLYHAGNATLAITGDIAPKAVRELCERYFGPLAGGPRAAAEPPIPALDKAIRISGAIPGSSSMVVAGWSTPRYFSADDVALDVAAAILSARLTRRLVDEQHLAEFVYARQRSLHTASMFVVSARLAAGKSADAVNAIVDEELSRLATSPPAPDELAGGRDQHVLMTVRRLDALEARGFLLATGTYHLGDPAALWRSLATRAKVAAAAVSRVVRAHLPLDRRVVGAFTGRGEQG